MLVKSIISLYISGEYHMQSKPSIDVPAYAPLYLTAVRLLKIYAKPVEYKEGWAVACLSCLRAYHATQSTPYGKLYITCPNCSAKDKKDGKALAYYSLLQQALSAYYETYEIDALIAEVIRDRVEDKLDKPISLMERLARLKTKA